MSQDRFGVVLDLVRDPRFAELWRTSNERVVPWAAFRNEEAPRGYTVEETFAVMTAIRHRNGTILPFANYMPQISGPDCWFSVTEEMYSMLQGIVSRSCDGSELDANLDSYITGHDRLLLLVDEFVSLGRRDGIAFERDRVAGVWNKTRIPVTQEDRIAYNFWYAFSQRVAPAVAEFAQLSGGGSAAGGRAAGRYAQSSAPAVTRAAIELPLIRDLNDDLIESVDFSQIEEGRRHWVAEKKSSPFESPDAALDQALDLANAVGPCAAIHPVFRALLISGLFWDFDPFEHLNALTELLVRSLFFAAEGLPALRWISLSHISEKWERGLLVKPRMPFRFLEETLDCGEGYDSTSHFTGELMLIDYELGRLSERIGAIRDEDRYARDVLEADPRFNPRQRDVLVYSLRNPGYQLTIEDHRAIYKVAYATARQDLVDLEAMGLLSQFKRGRAFWFQATPLLFEAIRQARK